jgi:uncharacterized protein (TIGR00730 family)
MRAMQRICVFCGSSTGGRPTYAALARTVGTELAQRKLGLVFGGGRVGLMGAIADAALAAGGEVIGVIPRALATKELAHERVTELHVVDSMHARKAKMAELSDGFIALPGGLGTLEELFEVLTWAQLGMHSKPVGLLDADDYYAPLLHFLDHARDHGFVRPEHRGLLLGARSPAALLAAMATWRPPTVPKWIDPAET